MKLQEFSFGYERELAPRVGGFARYIHKQVDVAIEDIGSLDHRRATRSTSSATRASTTPRSSRSPATSQVITYPKAVRDYDALEVGLDKRFSNNWSLSGSYTLSRLYGNYSALSQVFENGRTQPNIGRDFDYTLMSFDGNGEPAVWPLGNGPSAHQVKVQGVYSFDFGTTLGH